MGCNKEARAALVYRMRSTRTQILFKSESESESLISIFQWDSRIVCTMGCNKEACAALVYRMRVTTVTNMDIK